MFMFLKVSLSLVVGFETNLCVPISVSMRLARLVDVPTSIEVTLT